MTTLRAICTAFAPEYLERYPHLPPSHHKVIRAIQPCQSGHDGHRLSQCPHCGGHQRVHHSCGNRHCPQGQQHTTQQWLDHPLATQLPGPHFLRTFPVPETRRPCIRSPQRRAYQAMAKPLLSPSHGSPETSVSSVRTSPVLPVSCLPGAGSSSTTPTSTLSSLAVASQRTAQRGCPPEPTSLSP